MKLSVFSITLYVWVSFFSQVVSAADIIELKGLFGKKSALVAIDGQETILKVGQEKYGVVLIEVLKKTAIVVVNDQTLELSLSKQLSAGYKQAESHIVRMAQQDGGHYWSAGQINNRSVRFFVDTGASTIAMNLSTAKRLGIDYNSGEPARLSTANGIVEARLVVLNKVMVGAITQYNVAATVMLDDSLPIILLGNSFLSNVDMRTENGVLILESHL